MRYCSPKSIRTQLCGSAAADARPQLDEEVLCGVKHAARAYQRVAPRACRQSARAIHQGARAAACVGCFETLFG
jgi:hypothetical protein